MPNRPKIGVPHDKPERKTEKRARYALPKKQATPKSDVLGQALT